MKSILISFLFFIMIGCSSVQVCEYTLFTVDDPALEFVVCEFNNSREIQNCDSLNILIRKMIVSTYIPPNYPNPFSPHHGFSFTVVDSQKVILKLYDINDIYLATIFEQSFKPDKYEMHLNGEKYTPGNYRLEYFCNDKKWKYNMNLIR